MRRLFLKLFRRRRLERDLSEEMAFHRDMAAAGGNTVPFGNPAVIAEQARDLWRFTIVENLWRDVVYGARGLARTPGFALTAIVTLSLGIAANVLVFAVADAALFKPLPYRDPDSLVFVQDVRGRGTPFEVRQIGTTWRQVEMFRGLPGIFADVAPFLGSQPAAVDRGTGTPWQVGSLSSELLALLGIAPALGRPFGPDDAGREIVLLSDALWRAAYGSRRDIVGQRLTIDGRPHPIVGVMPPTFKWNVGGEHVAGWTPLDETTRPSFRGWIGAVMRLRPGVTIEEATRQLRAVVAASPEASSSRGPWDLELSPLDNRHQFYGAVNSAILILLGAVGCVLLIGCANIANLLLGRGAFRRHELGVRSALGASRARLLVQLLLEGIVLGLAAGVVAGSITWAGIPFVQWIIPPGLPLFVANPLMLDWRLLGFGCLMVTIACVLCSVGAAVHSTKDATSNLRLGGDRLAGSLRGRSLGFILQGTQLGLAFVLVSGTLLLTRNFVGIVTADLGYDSEGLLTAAVTPPSSRYPDDVSRDQFLEELAARVRHIPSVSAVTFGSPPSGGGGARIVAQGREEASQSVSGHEVAPEYFRVVGIALVAGRYFDERDRRDTERVCLVDANLARLLWPDRSAVGQRLSGPNTAWTTVVGVVSPIRSARFAASTSEFQVYWPIAQSSFESRALLVRTARDTAQVIPAMRSVATSFEPSLDLEYLRAVVDDYQRMWISPRFYFILMTLLGVIGLVTAVVGLYASTTYKVSQRTREIGIRLALGASRGQIRREIVRETVGPALAGMAAGLLAVFWLGAYVSSLLYRLDARDPWTLAAAAVLLIGASVLGALIPAQRATRVDPALTLRAQ